MMKRAALAAFAAVQVCSPAIADMRVDNQPAGSIVPGASLNSGAYTPSWTGSFSQTLQNRLQQQVFATDFGARFDGSSHPLSSVTQVGLINTTGWSLDQWQHMWGFVQSTSEEIDSDAIQAAVNYASGLNSVTGYGGTTVIAPCGKGFANTAISISTSGVSLTSKSRGGIVHHDVGTQQMQYCSHLVWDGASGATMLTIAPPTNTSTGQVIGGNNLAGILWDANQLAGTAVKAASIRDSWLDIGFAEPTGPGVVFDTVSLGEANDPQDNEIWINGVNINGTGDGLVLQATGESGAWNGNVSLNHFREIRIIHKNGDCMDVVRADHNITDALKCSLRPGGTGRTLVLRGNSESIPGGVPTSTPQGAYANQWDYVSGAGAIYAYGTTSYTRASYANVILDLDKTNGTPDPIVETGASVYWRRDDGIATGLDSYQLNIANSAANVTTLRGLRGNESEAIFSNGNSHLALYTTIGASTYKALMYIDSGTGIWTFINGSNIQGIKLGGSVTPVTVGGSFAITPTTVSSLPTCNTASKGYMATVTDASAPSYLGALTGGGSVVAGALCNGSAWVAH